MLPGENVKFSHDHFKEVDYDAVTGYAMLPNFVNGIVETYQNALSPIQQYWESLLEKFPKTVIPPAVVGWDASPRGNKKTGETEAVPNRYPFRPILTCNTANLFGEMLRQVQQFIEKKVPEPERLLIITAWNEITESAALLPKVLSNGDVDFSYLKKVKELKR